MTIKKSVTCFIFLFVLLTAINCNSTRVSATSRASYKRIYINQFKLTYFRQMLNKSYNNSAAIREVISGDNSGFAELILNPEDYEMIDSLTTKGNEELRLDSIAGRHRAEGAKGKRPVGFILDKLESKWLDSLAKSRYRASGRRGF